MNRAKTAVVNSGLSVATLVITNLLQFVYRTVLVYTLGVEYSGITGLCQNVIGLFALSELGISWAISYYLYKPLKENNEESVAAIVYFLKRLYKWVGCFIIVGGACVIPFLDTVIKGGEDIAHLQIIFALFLFNTAVSYLFFSYYQILATADRKNYMLFVPQTCGNIIMVCLQIVAVYVFHSFVGAVALSVLSTITINFVIRRKIIRIYPLLTKHKNAEVEPSLKREIVKYIKATMLYKVSLTVQTSSTTVIISYYIGLVVLGIYANYMLIVDTIRSLILSLINPMTSVIGELTTGAGIEEKEKAFNRLNFLMGWIAYFCVTCLFCLLTPFVTLWVGPKLTLPLSTLTIICVYFYVEFIISFSTQFRSACGLNNIGRFRPLITAVLNIVLAIVLVQKFELNGILMALLISRVTTLTWFEPWVVFKHVFFKPVWRYYGELIFNGILTFLVVLATNYIVNLLWRETIGTFALAFVICLILPNLVFVLIKYRTVEFQYYLNKVKSSFGKKHIV